MVMGIWGRLRRCFVLSCLLLLVFLLTVPKANAAEYGNIGGHPANPIPGNARSNSIFIHTINPTQTVNDGIKVVNYTNDTKTLEVYATDSIISSGGAFGCAQKVDSREGVGGWIKLAANEVTLAPSTEKLVPFTITAPKTAGVGEIDGCIVIQEKNVTQNIKQKGGGSVALSFRTAIRVAILIPGKITKQLTVVDYKVTKTPKQDFILQPKVRNDGNVSIDADLVTQTSNIFGLQKAVYEQQFPILRDAVSDWNIEYKRPFWGGFLTSRFIVSYDTNTENTLGDVSGKISTSLISKKVHFFSWPTPPALIIELGALLGLAYAYFYMKRRVKQRTQVRRHWVEYRVGGNEDINTIARRYGISWKTLAKTNKLKPPYALRAGDKIKVPPKKR